MELHKLFQCTDAENRAVSPVIGVILMVAITVILAAVIGTFVLGLGEQVQENPPQASFTFDYTAGGTASDCGATGSGDGHLDITHDGGDKITASELSHSGSSVADADSSWDGCGFGTNSDITAGDGVSTQVNSGDTVRVVWNAGADSSSTLGKWTGPDA